MTDPAESPMVRAKSTAMKLDTIKFKRVKGCPWVESTISRIIFKDCSVSIWLEPDGYFDEFSEDEMESPEPVGLTAFLEVSGKLVDEHEAAFSYFVANAAYYEKRLLDYLLVRSTENANAAKKADDNADLRAFIKKHAIGTEPGLKQQVSWSGLSLYDHGWEGVGFITVDFKCGWDQEHGISILMHKDKIIAESGLADFSNRGDSLIEHAKCIQRGSTGYDLQLP